MGWIEGAERRSSAEELMSRATKAASVLQGLGVSAGDGVALCMRNEPAYFEASFATGMLGAYPVAMNWHCTPDEARYLLTDCAAKVLVIHADLLAAMIDVVPEDVTVVEVETPREVRTAYGISAEQGRPAEGSLIWRTLVDAAPTREEPALEPPSTILYTSGTTGLPKGVRRPPSTPDEQAATAQMLGWSYGYTDVLEGRRTPETITTAVVGPVYHAAPNAHSIFSIPIGVNVLIMPRFDPEELLAAIARFRITHLNLVPIMFVRLLRLPAEVRNKYDLSSLEYVAHAAAPCPAPVKHAMIDWWGPVIWEYYGTTEMGNVTHISSQEWLEHPGSVGRIMPDTDLRIVDDQGADVPPGEVGEVIGRGRRRSDFTYQNAPEKRREMDRDGLIAPGDIGYFDADGFLYLCDRKSQMIISGGANIYPAEVEAELQRIPGVADCAVFGIPDDEFGEMVCAHVQLEPGAQLTAETIRADLRGVLTSYKIPKVVAFDDVLPREDSGKIFKRKLREPYWAGRETRI